MTVEVADLLRRTTEFLREARVATSHRKRVDALNAAEWCVDRALELVAGDGHARRVA